MSSVGFVPGTVKEIETLREAWKKLNDLLKNLANAEASLQKHDLQLTAVHLKVAKWNVDQAKKAIAAVGQAKNQKADRYTKDLQRACYLNDSTREIRYISQPCFFVDHHRCWPG
jgi:hypothetical protein